MQVKSYLFFDGRCEEALDFYRKALDAEVTMLKRFKEKPDASEEYGAPTSGSEDKIMHCEFRIGETAVRASDGRCQGQPSFQGFGLLLSVPDEASAEQTFNALTEGGQVQMPLGKTFFSPLFGMVVDRFGVLWMVVVAA
ncbi:VOC family protein [Methylococcus mesophilus]|uniref:VOC family protein n=1 Tax=Methylococcus mesophilus TaxID=2993564 RepID=UPI00224AB557|nr:VOC family protein [Methylococcus mesophilus]UZR27767.1 VOC family protein [Methylococcus mesophilus]